MFQGDQSHSVEERMICNWIGQENPLHVPSIFFDNRNVKKGAERAKRDHHLKGATKSYHKIILCPPQKSTKTQPF